MYKLPPSARASRVFLLSYLDYFLSSKQDKNKNVYLFLHFSISIRLHCIVCLDHFNLILLRHIIGDILILYVGICGIVLMDLPRSHWFTLQASQLSLFSHLKISICIKLPIFAHLESLNKTQLFFPSIVSLYQIVIYLFAVYLGNSLRHDLNPHAVTDKKLKSDLRESHGLSLRGQKIQKSVFIQKIHTPVVCKTTDLWSSPDRCLWPENICHLRPSFHPHSERPARSFWLLTRVRYPAAKAADLPQSTLKTHSRKTCIKILFNISKNLIFY